MEEGEPIHILKIGLFFDIKNIFIENKLIEEQKDFNY